jgi:phospholipase D-like protein
MNAPALAAIVVGAVGFEAYCQIDIFRADQVRYLPKWAWAGICLVSIPVGGIVYLVIGRAHQP